MVLNCIALFGYELVDMEKDVVMVTDLNNLRTIKEDDLVNLNEVHDCVDVVEQDVKSVDFIQRVDEESNVEH